MASTLPSLFVSHGAPTVALLDDAYTEALQKFGESFAGEIKGIIVVSAHWLTPAEVQISSSPRPPTLHDFGGFQEELYSLNYPAPGDPDLAQKVSTLLSKRNIKNSLEPTRGRDHGVWIPLRFIRPQADLPVLQLSIPLGFGPRELMNVGSALSSLREEGILLIGSGGAVHNLSELKWHGRNDAPNGRAVLFDNWLKRNLIEAKIENILDYEHQGAGARFAHPTQEHLMPLFFMMGSARSGDKVRFIYEGFQYGTLSMLTFALENHIPTPTTLA